MKNCSILHGRVLVMKTGTVTFELELANHAMLFETFMIDINSAIYCLEMCL